MQPNEVYEDMLKVRGALSLAQQTLEKQTEDSVEKEHRYRLEKALAFLKAEGKTVDAKNAEVELLVDDVRFQAKLAAGLQEATVERLRNLRTEMQALTSLAYMVRSEMELAR